MVDVAACTVTWAPSALPAASTPDCMVWKNGLSRPLRIAATFPVPSPPPPVLPPPEPEARELELQAARAVPSVSSPAAAIARVARRCVLVMTCHSSLRATGPTPIDF